MPPKCSRKERRRGFSNRNSVDEAMTGRRCVFLFERKSTLFGLPKVDAIRNHWLRLFTTEQHNQMLEFVHTFYGRQFREPRRVQGWLFTLKMAQMAQRLFKKKKKKGQFRPCYDNLVLLNQRLQVCFVISLSICYWLFQMWSFAQCWVTHCVCVCVCVCVRERETGSHHSGVSCLNVACVCKIHTSIITVFVTSTLFLFRAWTDGKTNDIINCLYIYFESWSSRLWKGTLHFRRTLVVFGQSHWVSWPIRADCACRKEVLCRKTTRLRHWKIMCFLTLKHVNILLYIVTPNTQNNDLIASYDPFKLLGMSRCQTKLCWKGFFF